MLYTENDLKRYSIYQLRYVARHVGVRSPTTKKREELIAKILAIQNGEIEPYFALNSKGRPAKECFMPNESNGTAVIYGIECDMSGDLVFRKPVPEYEGDGYTKVSGFVLESNYQYFLINFDNPMMVERVAFIPKDFADYNGIREGDKLVCEARYDSDFSMMRVQRVLVLNDCEFQRKGRPIFENMTPLYTKGEIDFESKFPIVNEIKRTAPLCYGDRGLIVGDKRGRLYSMFLPVAISVGDSAKVIMLTLNETPERVNEIKKVGDDKFELFYSTFSDAPNRQLYIVKMAINYVKRLVERGENVILFITDLEDIYQGHLDDETMYSIKTFFAMARNLAEFGSCTIVGGCSPEFFAEHKEFDNFMNFLWFEENMTFDKNKSLRHDN